MLEKLFSSQITNLESALSRTTQRQTLLTNNLANVNVPGYKRQDIDFHITLQGKLGPGSATLAAQGQAQAQAASDQTSIRNDGNNVDMEREITGLGETSLHYQALIAMTTDYFAGLKAVIKG